MSSWRFPLAILAILAFLAGCVSPAATNGAGGAADKLAPAGFAIPSVTALAQVVGDNLTAAAANAKAITFLVGHDAGEPTLGVMKDGTLFYAGATFKNDINGAPVPLPRTDILRSSDGGKTWKDVTPYLPGGLVREHPETGDPYVYVDTETGRVFDIDQRLLLGCHTVTSSDDKGATWSPDGKACLTPPADHQTIVAAKPRMLPVSPLYPKIVYYCNNQVAQSTCTRSLDGGLTFVPTGPSFLGVDSQTMVKPNMSDPTNPDIDHLCGGLHGHLKASADGIVYLPKEQCGVTMVAYTDDDGSTWNPVAVSKREATGDPSVAVDKAGNVYVAFLGAKDHHVYLARSLDKGKTYKPEVDVTPLGLTTVNLPALTAGDAGRVALAFVATSYPDPYKVKRTDNASLDNMTWDGYLSVITDANTDKATMVTTRVNDASDPLVRGECGPGRCNNPGLTDFIDVVMDGNGRPWVALVDNCLEKCAQPGGKHQDSKGAAGFVATLATGPGLLADKALLPALG